MKNSRNNNYLSPSEKYAQLQKNRLIARIAIISLIISAATYLLIPGTEYQIVHYQQNNHIHHTRITAYIKLKTTDTPSAEQLHAILKKATTELHSNAKPPYINNNLAIYCYLFTKSQIASPENTQYIASLATSSRTAPQFWCSLK